MLTEINNLAPFIEDNYREINVREYARLKKISPPHASKILKNLTKQKLLKFREERRNFLFKANRESKILLEITKIYWELKLEKLIFLLNEKTYANTITLFGSLSKLENTPKSDIDIAIFGREKEINLKKLEKEYKRKIQLFFFENIDKTPKNLKLAILNGHRLKGTLT
jgi:predicted nucleotidyltransferase